MNILKSMACTAVAAVGAYNLYLAADIQQEKSDLTFDTIELTASGAEAGGDVGGGGGGATAARSDYSTWVGKSDMDGWVDHYDITSPNYKNEGYQTVNHDSGTSNNNNAPYYTDKTKNNNIKKTGVEVRIGGRKGGIPGCNDGHWQINGSVCASAHYENGHKYKSEIVSLLCALFGNECDGWRYETAYKETINWDEEVE